MLLNWTTTRYVMEYEFFLLEKFQASSKKANIVIQVQAKKFANDVQPVTIIDIQNMSKNAKQFSLLVERLQQVFGNNSIKNNSLVQEQVKK